MSHQPVKLSLLLATLLPAVASADHIDLPAMSVSGVSAEAMPFVLPELAISNPDSGDLVKRLPGANINTNGPLTSIVQYRGLFSDRVNTLIDGVRVSQAGPNSMDSPLSYVAGSQVDTVSVYRGIAPVSTGIETIGGTVVVNSKQADYASSEDFEFHGDTTAGYATNGNTRYAGIITSVANDTHRFQLSGSLDRGNNLEFGDGDLINTEQQREVFAVDYGFQHDGSEINLSAQHHDTGKTGTPALPMDIIYARSDNYKLQFNNTLANGAQLKTRLNYQDADHRMSNYEFRNQSDSSKRYTQADVESAGLAVSYMLNSWTLGIDADQAEHNANIFNPTNAMFYVNNFNDIERDRFSAFAEWQGQLDQDWKLETGIRLSRINMDAGEVDSSMSMMNANVMTLRNQFNNADRSQSDNLMDLTAVFTHKLNDELDLELGLARKQRAPSYQERYLWLPMESTSGLADGNNHLGNINLNPETAYQAELGLDWHTPKAGFSPRLFYHHINDYIQGTAIPSSNTAAIMVSTMMGGDTTPLQFNNVDAKLYGFDANWYLSLSPQWQLDGTVSYVRGERRDTSDNLYRIAPLTTRTMLSYLQTHWRLGVEAEIVASQNKVSSENEEQKTAGYALYNLSASYNASTNLKLNAGINNVFDRSYQSHLAGYNRNNTNPDIAVGERLYGLGRSLYAGLNYTW